MSVTTSPAQMPSTQTGSFSEAANRLTDNLSASTLRLVDATNDFVALIRALVSAGQDLERSLAIHRELGAASQQALEDARAAAAAAAASAAEAQAARDSTSEMRDLTTREYATVSDIVANLQQRIAALSVLAAPLPYSPGSSGQAGQDAPKHEPPADSQHEAASGWQPGASYSEHHAADFDAA